MTYQSGSALYFVFLVLLASSCVFSACSGEEKQPELHPFIGYWAQYYEPNRPDVWSLRKFSFDKRGHLYCTEVELGTQARIWSEPIKARWTDTCLVWDRLRAIVSGDDSTMQMIYTSRYGQVVPIHLKRTEDPEYVKILENAEAAVGHKAAYQKPPDTGDGLETMGAKRAGLDSLKIQALFRKINKGRFGDIHSILVMKNGKLIVEEYFRADGKICGPYIREVYRDRIGEVASVTKSFTSALYGIAIREGYIDSINEPVFALFPEYPELQTEENSGVQIRHLLSMSSGLAWNENSIPIGHPKNDVQRMAGSDDLIQYCLSKDMAHPPGEKFIYSSGSSMILGEILKKKTGMGADLFAEKYLFAPLGITDYYWPRFDTMLINTAGGLSVRPRDLAKFGQMYLNQGKWQGKQVVPASWVATSTANHIPTLGHGYGYQWWRRTFRVKGQNLECYYAIGMNGKFIMVFPEHELVFVSTAQNLERKFSKLFYKMMETYLLPAVL